MARFTAEQKIFGPGVNLFTLEDTEKGTRLRVIEYGARVHELYFDGVNLVDNLPSLDAYRTDKTYLNAEIWPLANRQAPDLGDPQHRPLVLIDGEKVYLGPANERPEGFAANLLHSGEDAGTHNKTFRLATDPMADDDFAAIKLMHEAPDGQGGFPGNRTHYLTYILNPFGCLIDRLTATDRPTVVKATNHNYYNIRGSGTIFGTTLQLPGAEYVVEVNPVTLNPTGKLVHVRGTIFDFLEPTVLREEHGVIDNCFAFSTYGGNETVMTDPESGRRLTHVSDLGARQIYMGANHNNSHLCSEAHELLGVEQGVFPGRYLVIPGRPFMTREQILLDKVRG